MNTNHERERERTEKSGRRERGRGESGEREREASSVRYVPLQIGTLACTVICGLPGLIEVECKVLRVFLLCS